MILNFQKMLAKPFLLLVPYFTYDVRGDSRRIYIFVFTDFDKTAIMENF